MRNLPSLRGCFNGRTRSEKEVSQVRYNRRAFQTISVGYQIIRSYFFDSVFGNLGFAFGILALGYHREAHWRGFNIWVWVYSEGYLGNGFWTGWLNGHWIG
jgi:hypothetical protein